MADESMLPCPEGSDVGAAAADADAAAATIAVAAAVAAAAAAETGAPPFRCDSGDDGETDPVDETVSDDAAAPPGIGRQSLASLEGMDGGATAAVLLPLDGTADRGAAITMFGGCRGGPEGADVLRSTPPDAAGIIGLCSCVEACGVDEIAAAPVGRGAGRVDGAEPAACGTLGAARPEPCNPRGKVQAAALPPAPSAPSSLAG